MSSDSPIEEAKSAAQAVGELIKAAGDDPNAKKAAANIGKAAVTVTATINTILLPFAAINFGVEAARKYFQGAFAGDLSSRTSGIPLDKVIEPKPAIVAPAVQALAFAHDEPDLKALYLDLIATSMDARKASSVHPSFVEVIKQLSGEDARLLKGFNPRFFTDKTSVPIANVLVRGSDPRHTFHALRYMQPLVDLATGRPAMHPDSTVVVENWIRLGLVEVRFDMEILVEGAYNWVSTRPEVAQLKEKHPPPETVYFEHGIMKLTDFGTRFAAAVGMAPSVQSDAAAH